MQTEPHSTVVPATPRPALRLVSTKGMDREQWLRGPQERDWQQ